MRTIFAFFIFLCINVVVYLNMGLGGFLIVNVTIISFLLFLIVDKLHNPSNSMKKEAHMNEREFEELTTDYEDSKKIFKEKDLPSSKEISESLINVKD